MTKKNIDQPPVADVFRMESDPGLPRWEDVRKFLRPLASLKLTVTLFAMAIFIVLAGTLAQVEKDIWEVIDDYFRIKFTSPSEALRTTFAWIDFQIFFPPSFFPSKPVVPGGFYFPSGWLIGFAMAINLLVAHALRFKIQASGTRLKAGLAMIGLGFVLTYLVIASGSNKDGVQETTWFDEWATLWKWLKAGLAGAAIASVYGWIVLARNRRTERWLLILSAFVPVLLGGLSIWLFTKGDAAELGASSLRILWQLIKGMASGLVLLGGCALIFKKRAGIVLLHSGVMLMMFSELLVGTQAVEGRIRMKEGETVDFVEDYRSVQLAFVDASPSDHDEVVVIPLSILLTEKTIEDDRLPCNVKLKKFLKNSLIRPPKPDETNPATSGLGLHRIAEEVKPGVGTDVGGEVDIASAYIEFLKKDGSGSLGTYLLSQYYNLTHHPVDEKLTIDGKTFEVALRFVRTYKPYSLKLLDVRKDDYLGTNTPRNYSSDVQLVDETRQVDRPVKIWMNNPLRFAGETFYQSNYFVDQTGMENTVLQVVTNTGWMIPYVSCMIVATGLLAHFWIVLSRFLDRRGTESTPKPKTSVATRSRRARKDRTNGDRLKLDNALGTSERGNARTLGAIGFPLLIVLIFGGWLIGKARIPSESKSQMHFYEFGKLPLVYQGRVKPFDTLARTSLRIISNKQTFVPYDAKYKRSWFGLGPEKPIEEPAIRWLLDVIAKPEEAAEKHRIVRIENLDLLHTLGLERRKGYRYSVAELRPKIAEFEEQVELARKLAKESKENLSVFQKKCVELDNRIRLYTLLLASFRAFEFPPMPAKGISPSSEVVNRIVEKLQVAFQADRILATMLPPRAVPVDPEQLESGDKAWEPYTTAWTRDFFRKIQHQKLNPATQSLRAIFAAYADDDAKTFNAELAKYHATLASSTPEDFDPARANFEAFFNHFQPFYHSAVLYVFAFLLACFSWLGWSRILSRASFWLIVLTLVVHSSALIARIYISGRPPITNLYTTAVFIGWGCVVLAMIFEMAYRNGIGNVLACVDGFATLLIAHFLEGDGDTFVVLQAVLDTQFWLATHVVCINLGYATTFMAGSMGILYILRGVLTPSLSPKTSMDLSRMIYGTLCFAIFFSFVGTVLGGLWADDSWGRFWGWDPKENGALMIVLWNALVLHARWGGMVKVRGMAVLTIGGNIVTSWSWFGVNELGVGLHSYGFKEGTLRVLALFVISQLAIIGIGILPKSMWWSFRASKNSKEAEA